MTTFAKLNLKDQTDIVVLNAPDSFEREIASLCGVTVRRALSVLKQVDEHDAGLEASTDAVGGLVGGWWWVVRGRR